MAKSSSEANHTRGENHCQHLGFGTNDAVVHGFWCHESVMCVHVQRGKTAVLSQRVWREACFIRRGSNLNIRKTVLGPPSPHDDSQEYMSPMSRTQRKQGVQNAKGPVLVGHLVGTTSHLGLNRVFTAACRPQSVYNYSQHENGPLRRTRRPRDYGNLMHVHQEDHPSDLPSDTEMADRIVPLKDTAQNTSLTRI